MRPGSRRPWNAGLAIGLSLALLFLHGLGWLQPVEEIVMIPLTPLQQLLSGIGRGAVEAFAFLREIRDLRQEAQRLRDQVEELRTENLRLQELAAENAELRALLGIVRENPQTTFVAATVIGYETDPYLRYLILDVGTRQGVREGMPVITRGSALIGRIADAGLNRSRVRLLTDAGSQVGALLQTSRATGIVIGQPDGSLLLDFVNPDEEIPPGDTVLTSGIGGQIPRALVIGQVTERLSAGGGEPFQRARVRPAVDPRRITYVLVITSFPGMEPAP
ncbi:MAG: rod shape-determining protein MreC [Thermoflexus sp.]|jgi:rod shape-determining protein MreC|uniref:rod shape-determining protein MreC n=1 Tax=Thermoflexus TaxID=1495649 RepID=UPI001C76480E|nr:MULTISPECIES: rod shape-determining protein MreC [Thermoflexus]MDT7883450.1 rod shape-determining protein MreC [Thermoflexus sp.]MDT7947035.1 rod shape-determining protein MreC [Thermoflexus sp.]QWK11562.1 MAG: rod shape-determining protein MreC [Thermoflexus hugenholtzii]